MSSTLSGFSSNPSSSMPQSSISISQNSNSGLRIFAGASAMFSFTGLSHRIGRRILDYAKPRLAPDDAKQWIVYDLMDTLHHFLKGQWNEITEYNEDLVNRNLRIGEMFYASQHYYWHGLPKIYQGHFDAARLMVTKLSEIAEAYDNDIYRLLEISAEYSSAH